MTTIQQQVRTAEQHLAAVDPVMADVIAKHGPCGLAGKRRDPFHTLCSSIISQQLSSKAADTIQMRVMAGIGALKRIEPDLLVAATDRKSVVWGKSVEVRVDLGGRRIIKKKKKKQRKKRGNTNNITTKDK